MRARGRRRGKHMFFSAWWGVRAAEVRERDVLGSESVANPHLNRSGGRRGRDGRAASKSYLRDGG